MLSVIRNSIPPQLSVDLLRLILILFQAKLPFPKEYEQRIDDYLARNAKNRNNLKKNKKSDELHSYCLEDYGLSKEVVLTRFNNYIERYNLRDPVPTLSDDVPITLPQVPLH